LSAAEERAEEERLKEQKRKDWKTERGKKKDFFNLSRSTNEMKMRQTDSYRIENFNSSRHAD